MAAENVIEVHAGRGMNAASMRPRRMAAENSRALPARAA